MFHFNLFLCRTVFYPFNRQHPWFKENVPQYLYEYLENVKDSEAIEFNEMVLMELEDVSNIFLLI